MPRDIITTTTVYKFEELSPESQERAVQNIASKLGGDWWDDSDIEMVGQGMVYAFAEAIGNPDRENYGEGDFPGIEGIKLDGWDLGHAQTVEFVGTLNRENAPALPWTDDIESVVVRHPDYWRTIHVETDSGVDDEAMREAVEQAIETARVEGMKQVDYASSEENAREWINCMEPEFTVDGKLA